MPWRTVIPLTPALALVVLTACTNLGPVPTSQASSGAEPQLGVDLGSSRRAPSGAAQTGTLMPGTGHEQGAYSSASKPQQANDGGPSADATGTVNSVDPAKHTMNLSHGAIPAIGWPAMTMDFPVAPSVDLTRIHPGSRVTFTLGKGNNETYEIQSVQPAGRQR